MDNSETAAPTDGPGAESGKRPWSTPRVLLTTSAGRDTNAKSGFSAYDRHTGNPANSTTYNS